MDELQGKPSQEICQVCEVSPTVVSCGCCQEQRSVCGARCLLRHTEGRYEVHRPNEESEEFERMCSCTEESGEEDAIGREMKDPGVHVLELGDECVSAIETPGGGRCACCARIREPLEPRFRQCGYPDCPHLGQGSCPDCIVGQMMTKQRPLCIGCVDDVMTGGAQSE